MVALVVEVATRVKKPHTYLSNPFDRHLIERSSYHLFVSLEKQRQLGL